MSAAPPPLPPKKSAHCSAAPSLPASIQHTLPSPHAAAIPRESSSSFHIYAHRSHSRVTPRPQSCPRPTEHNHEESIPCSSAAAAVAAGTHNVWDQVCPCHHAATAHHNSVNHCCQCCEFSSTPHGHCAHHVVSATSALSCQQRASAATGMGAPIFSCRTSPIIQSSIACPRGHRVLYPRTCCMHAHHGTLIATHHCCCTDWLDSDTTLVSSSHEAADVHQHPSTPVYYRKDKTKNSSANSHQCAKPQRSSVLHSKNKTSANRMMPPASSSKLPFRIWKRVKGIFQHSPSDHTHSGLPTVYCQECGGRNFSHQRPRSSPSTPDNKFLSVGRVPKQEVMRASLSPRHRSNSYTEREANSTHRPSSFTQEGFDNNGFVCCFSPSPAMAGVGHCLTSSSTQHTCFAHQTLPSYPSTVCGCPHRAIRGELMNGFDGIPPSPSGDCHMALSKFHAGKHDSSPKQHQPVDANHTSKACKGQSSNEMVTATPRQHKEKNALQSSSSGERRHMSSLHYSTNNRPAKPSPQPDSSVVHSSTLTSRDASRTRSPTTATTERQLQPLVSGSNVLSTNHRQSTNNVAQRTRAPPHAHALSEMVSMAPPIVQPLPNRLTQTRASPPNASNEVTRVPQPPAVGEPDPESQEQKLLSFQDTIKALKKMGWYWGPLSMDEANILLEGRKNGTFLVRDSCHQAYILSLSLRAMGETYHTRIEHQGGEFSFWAHPDSHTASTIVEFIEKAVENSQNGRFQYFMQTSAAGEPPNQVSLLFPLSRFQVVPSLKHLCRFEILAHVRRDHIYQLPLPPSVKEYVSEKQYFAENLSEFVEAVRDKPALPFIFQKARQEQDQDSALSSDASQE